MAARSHSMSSVKQGVSIVRADKGCKRLITFVEIRLIEVVGPRNVHVV